MRDVAQDRDALKELVKGGGRGTVPCLKIFRDDETVQWLYESMDIIEFLRTELAS